MKYTKKLLQREVSDTKDAQYFGQLFEILNNEKSLEEFVEKSLSHLQKVKGKKHVVRRIVDSLEVLTDNEDEENNKEFIKDSLVYKKVKETKKPFFNNDWSEGDIYAGFPLNLKGKFIGALLIEEKQELEQWKELFVILHMLVFAFRYYSLIEVERNNNIKDAVTGLYNEKFFYNHFKVEEEKFVRFKTPMTLVLFQLENLQEINEKEDYETGEKVLSEIAQIIQAQARKIDMPARIERGLFAVLLSNTTGKGGEHISNRVKMRVGDSIDVNGKEINVKLQYSFMQFENHHSKESFLEDLHNSLRE